MRNYKVLHIWNTAGVAGYLAESLYDYFELDNSVITRGFDTYSLDNRFVKRVKDAPLKFNLRCLLKSLDFDILHFHSTDKMLRRFRKVLKNKPMIIHYHGSDIRDEWKLRKRYWDKADRILVSTKDLLEGSPDNVIYLPNIVNEKLCSQFYLNKKYKGSAFHVNQYAKDIALDYAQKYKLRINILNKFKNPWNHIDFLKNLSRYEYYIDVKRNINPESLWKILKGTEYYKEPKILKALSITGLEALCMGVKVIRYDGKRVYKLPVEHKSLSVTTKLIDIYEELIND